MSAGGNPPATTLLLIGCGKMGGALLKGWLKRGTARHVVVVEPGTGADAFAGDRLVERHKHPQEIPLEFAPDVVVFAVKPQVMDGAVSPYKRFVGRSLFLSIAAGKTLRYFARLLDDDAAVVRAMPNTPAAVGRGITVATARPPSLRSWHERTSPARIAACSVLNRRGAAVTSTRGGSPTRYSPPWARLAGSRTRR